MHPVVARLRSSLVGFLALALLAAMSCRAQEDPAPSDDPLLEAIVYTRLAPRNWDVYLFEDTGTPPRRLTSHPALDYNAVFSPDGRWVVFTSGRTDSADLHALDLQASSEPIRLTSNLAMDDAASFSPDGKWLAFVSTRDGDSDIFVMPFSPTDATAENRAVNLTRRPGGDFNPAFLQTGTRSPSRVNRVFGTRTVGTVGTSNSGS